MWAEFKKFIARGNVVDLAVGVIIGAAFSKIVNTLVDGILMPPIGLILRRIDFSNLMIVLDKTKGLPKSLADAKSNSIPVIAYGQLFTDLISFVIVAAAVFGLVKLFHNIRDEPEVPPTKKECPFCSSSIPIKARRCPLCTSNLEGTQAAQ